MKFNCSFFKSPQPMNVLIQPFTRLFALVAFCG